VIQARHVVVIIIPEVTPTCILG